jgi:tetratricopeptide (TPR) repeat protein
VSAQLGKQEEALVLRQRAFSLFESNMPATSTVLGTAAGALAASLAKLGREAEARALFDRATRILEAGYGPDHARVGELASLYGEAELDLGHVRQGLARLARGVEIQRKADKRGLDLSDALARLALAEAVAGDAQAGLEHAQEALAIVQRTRRSPVDPLIALGAAEVALDRSGDAITHLEQALELRGSSPPQRARAELFLARALWSADRPRAMGLAQRAAAVFRDDPYWRAQIQRVLAP